ncbi:MAG: PAS domain S-box protein, partial [Candidatus Kariarchaeaceae archaeon]
MKILFVDDEPDLLTIGKIYLEKKNADFEIITAESAKEAFKILEKEEIDVIVSDYQMPEVSGLEFLQLVRANNQDTPFIIFTGRGREEVAIAALNFGADRYVQKGGKMEVQYGVLVQAIFQVYTHSRTKDALVDSEKRYRSLFQTSPDGVIIASLENIFDYANEGFLEMIGYSLDELRVLSLNDISSEQFKHEQCHINQKQLKEKGLTEEFGWEFIAKNGRVIPSAGKLWYEKDKRGQIVQLMGIFRDKTYEKESYDIIQRKSEVEKLTLEISTDLINCSTEEIDDNIVKALTNVCRFSNSDHVYLNKFTEDKQFMINVYLISLGKGLKIESVAPIKVPEETLNRLKNNEPIIISAKRDIPREEIPEIETKRLEEMNTRISVPLLVKGELIGVVGLSSEMHDRDWNHDEINLLRTVGQILANSLDRGIKEEELKESKERYEQLTEILAGGVGTIDQEGYIIYSNNRLCEMLGYSLEELIGVKLTSFLTEEMQKRIAETIASKGISEKKYEKYVSHISKKDGSIIETTVSTQR